jgi:hypothetical protein
LSRLLGKDHIVPLACGGPDAVANMQGQTIADARAGDTWGKCVRWSGSISPIVMVMRDGPDRPFAGTELHRGTRRFTLPGAQAPPFSVGSILCIFLCRDWTSLKIPKKPRETGGGDVPFRRVHDSSPRFKKAKEKAALTGQIGLYKFARVRHIPVYKRGSERGSNG